MGNTPFSSLGAVGFALATYPIRVKRGGLTRQQAQQRVLATLHLTQRGLH